MKHSSAHKKSHLPAAAAAVLLCALACPGCSTVKSALAIGGNSGASTPIHNPFGDQYAPGAQGDRSQNMILRTKKGDRAVEIELPRDSQAMTDFSIPVSPAFREGGRGPASAGSDDLDISYKKRPPTMADHEITRSFPQGMAADDGERREIEEGLGVAPTDDSMPDRDQSYLSMLDHIKRLFRAGRYEAALLEIDGMIRQYPTAPRLHQMRGTLLDRMGQGDLALKSWTQALKLDPKNESLRRFVDRKGHGAGGRSVASP